MILYQTINNSKQKKQRTKKLKKENLKKIVLK